MHVFQAAAQAAAVYDDAGAPLLSPVPLSAIFNPVLPNDGTTTPSANNMVDYPSVYFDPVSRRWVLAAAYSDWLWSPDKPGLPLLAVSLTDSPLGDWKVYALPNPSGVAGLTACNPATHYSVVYNTQSTLDTNGIFITGELLCSTLDPTKANDTFAGAFIYAVPKAQAYDSKKMTVLNVAVYTDLQVKASADSRDAAGAGPSEWVQLQPARPQSGVDVNATRALFVAQVGAPAVASIPLLGWSVWVGAGAVGRAGLLHLISLCSATNQPPNHPTNQPTNRPDRTPRSRATTTQWPSSSSPTPTCWQR